MEFLSEWIREIVILLVFIVFLELLIPRSSVERFVRVVAGLLILVTVLKPVVVWIHDFHPMEMAWEDVSRESAGFALDPSSFLQAAYEQGLKRKIETYLAGKGYENQSVRVEVVLHTDEIVVKSVAVMLERMPPETLRVELCDVFDLPNSVITITRGGK